MLARPPNHVADLICQQSASTTFTLLRLRHTARLIPPACPPTVHPRERRPVALRTHSVPFSTHDSKSNVSAKNIAQYDEEELDAETEEDILRFLEEEEGQQTRKRKKKTTPHLNGSLAPPIQADVTTYDQDMPTIPFKEERAGSSMVKEQMHPVRRLGTDTPRLATHARFKPQMSRNARRQREPSLPMMVVDSIKTSARDIYPSTSFRSRHSLQTSPRCDMKDDHRRPDTGSSPTPKASRLPNLPAQTSLYTILARYLGHYTVTTSVDVPFLCTRDEHELLLREGLTLDIVKTWALSLLEMDSNTAARIFQRGAQVPPFFLVQLFLSRKHIRVHALGVVLNHLSFRLEQEPTSWGTLKTMAIRLIRHARRIWPESIPWISAIFLDKAAKIHSNSGGAKNQSPQMFSDMTHSCNSLLSLLSLPSSPHPIIASRHQESAQVQVLKFMAAYNPSIAVTRTGFRAVARIQLAHAKTEQEKDWAKLKGPSWPPWKESQTAMDNDKGYEYGASRASKILHRMFEAGYAARNWEEMAQVYAGWDNDLSPTIQTRTVLPSKFRDYHTHHLWVARIRTTRTRREAWACFLAHETSGAPAHEEIYLAMFEKLYYMELQRLSDGESHQTLSSDGPPEHRTTALLPGDMKEVLSEPPSPLHNVYLSESVPTYEQLFDRMMSKNVQPTRRLLAFLLETYPDFATTFKLLEKAKDAFHGGVGCLLAGNHGEGSTVHQVPVYLLTAFIRFLCRFGRPTSGLPVKTAFLPQKQHARQFIFNENYLLEYAYALLLHYKPRHQPAWAAFMERIVFSRFGHKSLYSEKDSAMGITDVQYRIVCKLLDTLASIDVDVDGDLFTLTCTATRYAAQAVHRGNFSVEQAREFLSARSYRLRTLFHGLAGVHADPKMPAHATSIPPRVPGPSELHAYVRALGVLRDYEGLYSFSTWLTKHNVEVIARAREQRGGDDLLFRTLVALRAATGGWLEEGRDSRPAAPAEIIQLIKAQIDSVKEWGGWPSKKYVTLYIEGHVRSATPEVGGR